MQRRRGLWLVFAVVLFGLGAWLMLSGQGEEEAPEPKKVAFPYRMRPAERALSTVTASIPKMRATSSR